MGQENPSAVRRFRRAPAWSLAVLAVLASLAFAVTSSGSAKPRASAAAAGATNAQVQALMNAAFGGGTKVTDLPKIAQDAYRLYAKPITAAEKKVIERCLKTTGKCDLGKKNPEAKLNVADSEDQQNPYWVAARPGVLLMALREPAVKSVTYTNSAFKVPQTLTNFRANIAQGADVIVGAFDLGDVMLPVIKQAAAKHITVWTATQSVPSAKFNGQDLGGDVLVDLCKYGTTMAKLALKAGKDIAMYTGPPGNTFAPKWQACAKKTIAAGGGKLVENGNTGWTPQGEQQAAAALAAKGLPDALIYDYTPQAFIQKFVSLKKTPPTQVGGSQSMGAYKAWKDANAKGYKFKSYIAASEQTFMAVALHAAVAQHLGKKVPRHVVLPQPVVPAQDVAKYYSPAFPSGANFGSGLPGDLLRFAYAHSTS
jgi:ABC-type sugar transport system substrate-binding protein